MKVYRKNDKIIFEIPYWSERYNPYLEEFEEEVFGTATAKPKEKYPTLVGMTVQNENGTIEMGWSKVIDLAYKGKADQFTSILIHWWGSKEEFEKINKQLGIPQIGMDFSSLNKTN